MSKEEWKDMPGWKGIYRISSHGRCKRIANGSDGRKIKERFVSAKPAGWRGRYLAFPLTWNNKTKDTYVHRAVLIAFAGWPPNKKYQCNHKDGNKHNNHLSNLEWVTPTQNQRHRYEVLGQTQNGENNPGNKYTEDEIVRILKLYQSGKYSQREIARITAIDYRYVNAIVHRKAWKHITIP